MPDTRRTSSADQNGVRDLQEHLQSNTVGYNCQDAPAHLRKVLLIDDDPIHAQCVIEILIARDLGVDLCVTPKQAQIRLKRRDSEYSVVIVNVSSSSQPWRHLLRSFHEASGQSGAAVGPLFLCVSSLNRGPLFELEIERAGGRLVYER